MRSFAVEVDGEANPLTAQLVLRTLSAASDSHASQQSLQVATQQLSNWERIAGYHLLLQTIYSDHSIHESVRLNAIIQLKNGVDKYWRKTSTHAIGKDEKIQIRSRAVELGIREPKPALALQNALMLSKIVRLEFPHDWPDVIATIIDHLRATDDPRIDSIHVRNILAITLQVIKELSSGRLRRTKKSLESVSSELLHALGQVYVNLAQQWSQPGHLEALKSSHAAIKALRRLIVAGFEHPHRDLAVKQFWERIQQHHEIAWSAWKQSSDKSMEESSLLMKHLFQYVKLYLDMARIHPASFVLLGSMDVLARAWSIISGDDAKDALSHNLRWSIQSKGDVVDEMSPIEKLALKGLLLFRACVKMVFNPIQTFKYQHPSDKEDRKEAIDRIRNSVFSSEFALSMMEVLVIRYFILRPADLRDWEEEPDEWEKREEEIADAWEFSTRACSEKLFLDLIINFKELLVPRLLQVFQQYATVDNHDVLLKESLYSAIGTAAACVEDVFDFNSFIRSVLVPEMQLVLPNYNLLRRRTAILLGQWVPIKPDSLDRRAIYQIFTFLLSGNDALNDHVVKVTAGRQLRLVLEPFEFRYEDFEPYATPILSNIMVMISKTDLTETKMALLETVRVAVTKLEGKIEPYADGIMSILPSLWAESGEEHLMKQAILTMITAIITSLGPKSVHYHGPILSLIQDSVRPGSEALVYLLEEALELWTAVLQQTPTTNPVPSPDLLDLSHSLLPLLTMGTDHLRQCFELIESYTCLSPATMLKPVMLTPLLESMKDLLSILASSRARDASLAPHVLENMIATIGAPSSFGSETRLSAIQHLLTTLVETGYLTELLRILKDAHDYHQNPQPNRRPPEIIGVGETSLFTVLARLALVAPDLFVQAIDATGNKLDWVVQEWIEHFDSVGDTIRKKIQLLGLTNLFSATSPPPRIMLESLQSLMGVWNDLLLELSDGAADENDGDYLWSGPSAGLPDWPDEPAEDARKRSVANYDPCYTVNLRTFIAEQLKIAINACGGQQRFEQEWLSKIDSEVLKSFAELKIL